MKAFVSIAIELSDDELFVVFRWNMIAQSKVIEEKNVRSGHDVKRKILSGGHDEMTNHRFAFFFASSYDYVISCNKQMRKYFMHLAERRRRRAEPERKKPFVSFPIGLVPLMKLGRGGVQYIPDADFEWIDPKSEFISDAERTSRQCQISADLIDNRIAVFVFLVEVQRTIGLSLDGLV